MGTWILIISIFSGASANPKVEVQQLPAASQAECMNRGKAQVESLHRLAASDAFNGKLAADVSCVNTRTGETVVVQ